MTTLSFDLSGTACVKQGISLVIYDLRGRVVRTLIDSELDPGRHQVSWNGRDDSGRLAPSGFYLYTLKAGETRITRKMLISK